MKNNKSRPANSRSSQDRQQRAYAAGARMAKARISCQAPEDARALDEVDASDVVVVGGCYDHVERVLGVLDLPYTALDGASLRHARLRPEQLLVVNCPGTVGKRGIAKIRDFVAEGGSLFTTDWALRNVIEPAFPGLVEFNDKPTRDDVVRIEVCSKDNPFLAGVLDGRDDPQWWLEGSSYPIRVLDPSRVEVLLRSRELEKKYGEAAVAVLFQYGKGEVFHMISHYYLQRTELRDARHQKPAASYFAEKGVPMGAREDALACDLSLGELESAATSTRLIANLVARKKRKVATEPSRSERKRRPLHTR